MTDMPAYLPDSPLALAIAEEEAEANAPLRARLIKQWQFLCSAWHTSRQLRVLTFVATIVVIAMVLIGWSVMAAIQSHIFDRAVDTDIERYEGSYASVQSLFSTPDSTREQTIQNIADQVISSQYDATHEVIGAVLLPGAGNTEGETLAPSTETTTQLTALITEEFRTDVTEAHTPQWREVTIPRTLQERVNDAESGRVISGDGILIGQTIDVSRGEYYEFYIVYSLNSEDDITGSIRGSLIAGFIGLFAIFVISIYVVVHSVLQPVRNVATNAQQIADGNYDVRMKVRGRDELAQLAESFNRMASSIQDQFVRYERVASVQQGFVSAVSHELRTPVTTIRMAGQLIYDKRDELPQALRRSVELQHEHLINLDTMLSDLLEISRYDAGAMELHPVDMNIATVVESVVESQIPLADAHGVEVQVVIDGETTVAAERRRVERIIRNLVVNALEHSEGHDVRIRVVGGESAVAVEVSDRGVGLSEEQAENVFKRFWRADSSRVRKSGGTGLGMTLAREDAEFHGGTLDCIGILGVGATFLLTLPRTPGDDYEPPLDLAVGAVDADWGISSEGSTVEDAHEENDTAVAIEEAVSDSADTADARAAEDSRDTIDAGGEETSIKVHIPSAGVAVISTVDDDRE